MEARNGPVEQSLPIECLTRWHELAQSDTDFPESGTDERLFELLMYGATVEAAAHGAGISRRTAYRRLEDPGFRQSLEHARARVRDNIVQRLIDASGAAIDRLWHLLEHEDENVQLKASGLLLSSLAKVHQAMVKQPEVTERYSQTDAYQEGQSHLRVLRQEVVQSRKAVT